MTNFRKYLSIAALVLTSSFIFTSCNKDDDDPVPTNPIDKATIVSTVVEAADFSILEDALVKANLVSALTTDGPFTVFAPTNQAFENLFMELGVDGISDLSAEVLKPILLYHVVGASAKSSSLNSGYIESLNTSTPSSMAASIYLEVGSDVKLNGSSMVSTADVEVSNGVIHIIDKVLLPPNVVDFALSNPDFSILVEAVSKAGLVDALMAEGPFTLFAPTNAAFEMLFEQLNVSGISDLTAEALTPILLYHVVNGNVNAADVTTGMVPTLNTRAELDIKVSEMGVMINDNSKVVAVDVQGTNGVIHVIDKVLLP